MVIANCKNHVYTCYMYLYYRYYFRLLILVPNSQLLAITYITSLFYFS